MTAWHLVTGEYPPQRGGVSHYTALLAAALAAEGETVHVWCSDVGVDGEAAASPHAGAGDDVEGVTVHRVGGRFRGPDLRRLDAALQAMPAPRRVLVQYAPQAFGMRGMNLGFCRWVLRRRRRGDDVRVMFHEPFFPFGRQKARRNVLAAVNRLMASELLAAARVAYVSVPAWAELLRPYAGSRPPPFVWLPVPATVAPVDDPAAVRAVRFALAGSDGERRIVGHFGTYGALIAPLLEPAMERLLASDAHVTALFLGDGGKDFAAGMASRHPEWSRRLVAPGWQTSRDVSLHLQACDVVVQPYPDGASARRTTLMAALANGAATVTTVGRFTEDVWRTGPIPLAPAGDDAALADAAARLLADDALRAETAAGGRAFYERLFGFPGIVEALLNT